MPKYIHCCKSSSKKGVYSEKRPTLREKSLNNLSLYSKELEKDLNKQPHFITQRTRTRINRMKIGTKLSLELTERRKSKQK